MPVLPERKRAGFRRVLVVRDRASVLRTVARLRAGRAVFLMLTPGPSWRGRVVYETQREVGVEGCFATWQWIREHRHGGGYR